MIRLLGAITGSALALAALLVLVGVPQFKARESELDQVLVTLPLRAEPIDEARPDDANEAVAAEEAVDDIVAAVDSATTEPINQPAPVEPAVVPAAAVADTPVPATAPTPAPIEEAPALQPDTPQWYAFWSPFRSEIAASGFVAQLQRVTGLDYRVVKIKPGVYEVAFAYAEDADIPNNLSQISAATGLDMPGN